MAHIKLNNNPGIVSLFIDFPEVGAALSNLAQVLLRNTTSKLPTWFREFVASYVSSLNRTEFCGRSHMAAARACGGYTKEEMYEMVEKNQQYKSLVELARMVTGNEFTGAKIEQLLADGITREDIHDVVAIASAFSMYNRYVSGLGVNNPKLSKEDYTGMGQMLAARGYVRKQEKQEGDSAFVFTHNIDGSEHKTSNSRVKPGDYMVVNNPHPQSSLKNVIRRCESIHANGSIQPFQNGHLTITEWSQDCQGQGWTEAGLRRVRDRPRGHSQGD